jgi:hypothetical protein
VALRELAAIFGIEVDDSQLKKLNSDISDAAGTLKNFGTILAGAFAVAGIAAFTIHQIELGAALNDTAQRLGVGTDELQKFEYAAGLAGVSTEGAGNALKFLNKALGGAVTGNKEAAKAFAELGVEVKGANGEVRPSLDILADVADGFNSLGSQGEKTTTAMKLFGRGGLEMIPVLNEGGAALRAAAKEFDELGGGLSGQFVKDSDEADDAMFRFRATIKWLSAAVVSFLVPAIKGVATFMARATAPFVKLAKETNLLKVVFMSFVAFLGVRAIPMIVDLGAKLVQVIKFARLMGYSWKDLILTGLKFAGPILLVLGLVLLFEDLYTLLTGGESALGDFLDEFGGIGAKQAFVDSMNEAWTQIKSTFTELKPTLSALAKVLAEGLIAALPYLLSGFKILVEIVTGLLTAISGVVKAITMIPNAIKTGNFDGIELAVMQTGNALFGNGGSKKGLIGNAGSDIADLFSGEATTKAPIYQPSALRGPNASVQNQSTNNINVTVNGGSDPKAVGAATKEAVSSSLAENERKYSLDAMSQGGAD